MAARLNDREISKIRSVDRAYLGRTAVSRWRAERRSFPLIPRCERFRSLLDG
jgi:hypothetical protein